MKGKGIHTLDVAICEIQLLLESGEFHGPIYANTTPVGYSELLPVRLMKVDSIMPVIYKLA